ncbi:MAG TPA: efflux RND transporter periplasmic adaptor subunit [Rhizomicrobium sp.]|nr:efflux RND transporter periplasmic adaptor subunit [Rhizomicrobium sp.]
MKRISIKLFSLKAGAAALALTLASSGASTALAQQAQPDPPSVGVVAARVVKLAPKMALPGTVVSLNDSKLAAEVEGRISWVAEVGTVLPADGVVARIDQSVAKLQLDSDRANVARLSAQVKFDRAQAARMDNLFSQNAIARATRDQAVSTRDADVGGLAQAKAAMMKSQYQYDHSIIRAPFPGRVVQRLINPGEYATVGKDIVRLVDIASLEVSAQTPIDSARYLHEGASVTMLIEGRPVQGTVRAIVPVGDVISRSIELRIIVPANAALVGDAAKVFIPSGEPRNVLAVPRDALVLREDNTYVFKVDGKNTAQRIAVETGTEDGALVEIKGPIAPGERVIVRGAERLEAGEKVRAIRAS